MSTFSPQLAVPSRVRPDLTKHVNFTYGMVLGVDDFNQEFAYLSGLDRWIVRDLIGYGTVSGLRVEYEPGRPDQPGDRGPRITVSPGVGASPSGRMICVAPAQCAYVDEWLAANNKDVESALYGSPPGGSPPSGSPPSPGSIDLYVVLCYRDCLTDAVPIPGEPCRSEDDLMAPSRLQDGFALELRLEPPNHPPDQREEDAVRRFVGWLRQVPLTGGTGTGLPDLLDAIRTAAGVSGLGWDSPPAADTTVTCPPVGAFMATAPDPSLAIPADRAAEFFRAAFRLWATELLPCWRAAVAGCGNQCGDGITPLEESDCLLLSHFQVDVVHDEAQDRLLAGSAAPQDEERRPFLVDLRVLEEWALTELGGVDWLSPPSPAPGPSGPWAGSNPVVVAAGRFDKEGGHGAPPFFSWGGLEATPRIGSPDMFDLDFPDFHAHPDGQYLVSGTVLADHDAKAHTLEVLVPEGNLAIRLRAVGTGSSDMHGFMLQVARFEGVGP